MEIGSASNDIGEEDNYLPALWELDGPEYECDCPGPPPPPFRIPPPPRPPYLSEIPECPEFIIADYESCDVTTVSIRITYADTNTNTNTNNVKTNLLLGRKISF